MLKYEGICQSLLTQIQDGALPAGTKLPSIPTLMQIYSCSKSTGIDLQQLEQIFGKKR